MDKIFVSVVSYRDPLLEKTIRNLYDTKSANTQIFVGVFEQTALENSLEVKAPDLLKRMDIRYKRIDPKFTMGVGWARYNNALQVKDEDYFYQIDSHMQFDQNWDEKLIEDFKIASEKHGGTNKIIISSACKNFEIINDNIVLHTHPTPKTSVVKYFDYDKNLNLLGAHGDLVEGTNDVMPAIHICAGNFFTHTDWVYDVGPDGRMYFSGEEQKMVLSSFLAGYHIYHPREITSYHFNGSNDYVTKVWFEPIISEQDYAEGVNKSYIYWNKYLKSVSNEQLQKFYDYSGVDYINQTLDERAKTYSIITVPIEEREIPKETPWGTKIGNSEEVVEEIKKMPGSVGKFDDVLMRDLEKMNPSHILDIGAGSGNYGRMIKEKYPSVFVAAIEPTQNYIKEFNLEKNYNQVFHATFDEVIKYNDTIYDLALCIDVLEHMKLSEAIDALEELVYCTRWIAVIWPNDVNQNSVGGNFYEKHRSNMQLSDLLRFDIHHYEKIKLENNGRQNYNYALIAGMHSSYYK
jgi:hypothetical protein